MFHRMKVFQKYWTKIFFYNAFTNMRKALSKLNVKDIKLIIIIISGNINGIDNFKLHLQVYL